MKPFCQLSAPHGPRRPPGTQASPAPQPIPSAALLPPFPGAVLPPAPRRPSHRERILDAAEAVVREHGAAHLTLDAVAERAGVSKGGLLYHFKSKETLLQAMIDRHFQSVDARHAAALETLPPGPGRELKAWTLAMAANEKCVADKQVGCAMLAAAANDPRLLEPFHRFQQWRLRLVEEAAAAGLPFARAALASLAVDGLALLELHQLSPYDATRRRAILEEIARYIDETAAAASVRAISQTNP